MTIEGSGRASAIAFGQTRRLARRKREPKHRATARTVLALDVTAMRLDDRATDGEAEPSSAACADAIELLEDLALRAFRQSRSAIGDLHDHFVAFASRGHVDRLTGWRVLRRVLEQ